MEFDLLVGQLNGGAQQFGGLAGRKGQGAIIGQRAQEREASQRLRFVSCQMAEVVRADRIPWRVSRGRVRSQEGVGRALRKAPLEGLVGEGGAEDHGQRRMPPEAALPPPLGLPWHWDFSSPGLSSLSSAIRELISHI